MSGIQLAQPVGCPLDGWVSCQKELVILFLEEMKAFLKY